MLAPVEEGGTERAREDPPATTSSCRPDLHFEDFIYVRVSVCLFVCVCVVCEVCASEREIERGTLSGVPETLSWSSSIHIVPAGVCGQL